MTTYFIAANGNDANSGLSESAPWLTIGKVNSRVQVSGDIYSFRGGDTFTDATLTPNSSGTTFTSYGTGNATISRVATSGFQLTNLSNITVSNIDFVGSGGTTNPGLNCTYSTANVGLFLDGLTVSGFPSDGIRVFCNAATGFLDNVQISDCEVSNTCTGDTGSQGTSAINLQALINYPTGAAGFTGVYNFSNVVIKGCYTHDNPGVAGAGNWTASGIFIAQCNQGLITECVAHDNSALGFGTVGIWTADSRFVTIQFCESYRISSTGTDGDGFDLESGSFNCVCQFCYSHDNGGHGFLLEGGDIPSDNNTLRFCVSQNDAQNGIFDQAGIKLSTFGANGNTNLKVYCNTVFGSTATAFCSCLEYSSNGPPLTGIVSNNIFYSGGNDMQLTSNGSFGGTHLTFAGNCYFATGVFAIEYPTGQLWGSLAAFRAGTGQERINRTNVGLEANPGLVSAGNGGTINVSGVITPDLLAGLSAYSITSASAVYRAGLNLLRFFAIDPTGLPDFYENLVDVSTLSIGADCLGTVTPVPRTGNLAYVFRFSDAGAAKRDPIVGPIGFTELLVFNDLTKDSVVSSSGFWCSILQSGEINTVLFAHPNVQLVFNQSELGPPNNPTVILSKIPTAHIGIIVSNFGNFISAGLT